MERGFNSAISHPLAPSWLFAFGAPVIFRDFDLSVAPTTWLLAGLFILAAVVSWPAMKATATSAVEPDKPTRSLEREFACGAVMVVGIFVHGSSYLYKMVFAAWLLPWLWRASLTGRDDSWRKMTLALLLAVLGAGL